MIWEVKTKVPVKQKHPLSVRWVSSQKAPNGFAKFINHILNPLYKLKFNEIDMEKGCKYRMMKQFMKDNEKKIKLAYRRKILSNRNFFIGKFIDENLEGKRNLL